MESYLLALGLAMTVAASCGPSIGVEARTKPNGEGGMVYLLGEDNPDMYSYGHKELDGDINKAEAIDLSRDGGIIPMIGTMLKLGRPVRGEHMPTRIMREGPKRFMPDVVFAFSIPVVNDAFKKIVERFELGVHPC